MCGMAIHTCRGSWVPISCTWSAESRQTMALGNPGADGSHGVTFRGLGVGEPVESPAHAFDNVSLLKLPKPVVGDTQLFELARTKEAADARLAKGVLTQISGHCISNIGIRYRYADILQDIWGWGQPTGCARRGRCFARCSMPELRSHCRPRRRRRHGCPALRRQP